jgi:hypothetical protein
MKMNICKQCEKEFEPNKMHPHQKYCCSKCNFKAWQIRNPKREKELGYNNYLKNRPDLFCKECGIKIPDDKRKNGLRYCSEKCVKNQRNRKSRIKTQNIRDKYAIWKKSIGCSKCGYNTCGGSLDFHHTNPEVKERRIDAKAWIEKTKLYEEELKKCVLLCKNCHHEEHEKMKREKQYYKQVRG